MESLRALTLMIVLALGQAASAQTRLPVGRGAEWLSWKPGERAVFVSGYISGYLSGFIEACDLADELFLDKPHPPDKYLRLSGRCLAHRHEFSKTRWNGNQPNVSAYTDVITAFYERHASCRDFFYSVLLQELNERYMPADELYETELKGGIKHHNIRAREWCSADVANPRQ
jgi:hypothetical protein